MDIHRSDQYYMRGSGIGSIFSTIYRGLIPLAKNVLNTGMRFAKSKTGKKILKTAKRTALDAGLNIANDALQGENIKESVQKRMRTAGDELVDGIQQATTQYKKKKKKKKVIARHGGGRPKSNKKKKLKKNPKKKKKKKGSGKKKKGTCHSKKPKKKTKTTKKKKNTKKSPKKRDRIPSTNHQLLKHWV